MKEMKKLVVSLQETINEMLSTEKLSKLKWFRINILFAIKTPWWLLIKPLGVLFHTKQYYRGSYNSYNDGQKIDTVNIKNTNIVYFAKIFPIFFLKGKKLNKKDLKNIFGDNAGNVDLKSYENSSFSVIY